MPDQQNITNIPSNRVEFIDPRTGLVSREWYRFFLNLFNLAGAGGNQISLDEMQIGPPPQPDSGGGGGGTGTVTSVDVSGGTTGLTTTGGPITSSGTITLEGTLNVANGGTGADNATTARVNLVAAKSGANSDITSMTGVTGGISTPDYIDFDTAATTTRQSGRLWWDNSDSIQTLNLGMAGSNATMQVGQEVYFRVKASSAITEGQVVMFTGTVGASGGLTAAPATGLTATTAQYVMGVATENIALNGWGYITQFGLVRGINTIGGAEAWIDGQILYYDPAVAGGLTKTLPSAPNAKVVVAAVVHAASNGSLFIRPAYGGELGQFEGNVGFGALANGDLIQYDSAAGKWKNVPSSTFGTGSVTSVDTAGTVNGLTLTGGPITTSGTITLGGTLDLSSPPAIGGTTPAAGTFTTLTATGQTSLGGAAGANNFRVLDTAGSVNYWNIRGGDGSTTSPRFATDGTGTNIAGQFASKGTGAFQFLTGGTREQLRVADTASAVNYVQVTGAATGNRPTISAQGSDSNMGLGFQSKGTFGFSFLNSSGGFLATITHSTTTSATNYVTLQASQSGTTSVGVAASGTDTNIDLTLTPKGTGVVRTSGTGVRLYGSTSGYVGLKGAAAAGSTTYTLPAADGTSGQVLSTNGSATLSWATAASGNTTSLGMWENNTTISSNYSVTSGNNAMSAGPITVASGVVVTVPSGSVWTIV